MKQQLSKDNAVLETAADSRKFLDNLMSKNAKAKSPKKFENSKVDIFFENCENEKAFRLLIFKASKTRNRFFKKLVYAKAESWFKLN